MKQKALFTNTLAEEYQPLAERLRPQSWEELKNIDNLDPLVVEQLKNPDTAPISLILWGPPGCGKTSLARLIGKTKSKFFFQEFSAVMGGLKDLREIFDQIKYSSTPLILFLDEIHHFNKSQQDALLPYLESGKVILIGATTENPSFVLNNALLSRARLLQFSDHSAEDLLEILNKIDCEVTAEAQEILLKIAAGDARSLISTIELLLKQNINKITKEVLEKNFSALPYFYDASGDQHYQMISAFIKSMRAGNIEDALQWGLRMIESGEDPRYICRRMIIFAAEDIGNKNPHALILANQTFDAFQKVGLPEGLIPITQCIEYLTLSPKSRQAYNLMKETLTEIRQNRKKTVPKHLRNN